MPRYFFNVHDSRDIPDEDGIVFPGPDAAREQAVIAAGEMLKDLDGGAGEFRNGGWSSPTSRVRRSAR